MRIVTALALLPAVFAPHSGWHTGHTAVRACPGVSAARCVQAASWASTIRRRDCAACIPHRTLGALPPDGIILQVLVSVERPPTGRAFGEWPPTIRRSNLSGIEGVASQYGVFQRAGRYGAEGIYLWALFGRAHPTLAQLDTANAELHAMQLSR